MRRNILSLSIAAMVGGLGLAASAAPAVVNLGRHIRLGQSDGVPGRVRFLSSSIALGADQKTSWITLTRVGNFNDPRYGDFAITPAMLAQMVSNFDKRVLGQDVFIDVAHRPDDGAAAKVLRLSVEGERLRALVEWTPFGVASVKDRGFTYLSAEYHEAWEDNEQKQQHGCVLLGAGLTNRPVIKHLEGVDPKRLSQEPDGDHVPPARVAVSPQLIKELQEQDMNFLDQLRAHYKTLGLAEDVITKLLAGAKAQFDAQGSDPVKLLGVLETWKASGQAVGDYLKTLAQSGTAPQNVTITLAQPAADVNKAVQDALKAQNDAKTLAQTTLAGKVVLLVRVDAFAKASYRRRSGEIAARLEESMVGESIDEHGAIVRRAPSDRK